MNTTNDKKPLDIPETVQEDLKRVIEEATDVLKEKFKTFADDLANFEKNHEEKRKKLFNGNRRRTSGRVI